jgi:hypothetical protein
MFDTSTLSAQDPSLRGYEDRIKAIRKKSDAGSVQKLIAEMNSEWGEKKDTGYYRAVIALCGAVTSSPGGGGLDSRQIVRTLATTVIDAAEKPITIDEEVGLILLLQGDPDNLDGKLIGAAWEKERLIRINRWLSVWQHLRIAKSRLPAVIEQPETRVMPPPGAGKNGETIFPGMSPSDVKDPFVRKQYEELIAKNREKIRIYDEKWYLERLDVSFVKPAKRYIINAYSSPPYQTEELEKVLEKSGMDKVTRVEIITEVRRRIADRIAHEAKYPDLPPKAMTKPPPDPPGPDAHHADARLRKRVTINVAMPKVDAALEKLREATGVRFTFAGIQNVQPAVNGIFVNGVPAWEVMDAFAADKKVDGRWEKDGDGYRIVPRGEPLPTPPVVSADAEANSLLWIIVAIVVISVVLLAAGGVVIWLWRRKSSRGT